MAKTNVCLIARMCASWFFGYNTCVHVCAWHMLARPMGAKLREDFPEIVKRVYPEGLKNAEELLKGIYFG